MFPETYFIIIRNRPKQCQRIAQQASIGTMRGAFWGTREDEVELFWNDGWKMAFSRNKRNFWITRVTMTSWRSKFSTSAKTDVHKRPWLYCQFAFHIGLPDAFCKNTETAAIFSTVPDLSFVVIRKRHREHKETMSIVKPQLILPVFWLAHYISVCGVCVLRDNHTKDCVNSSK